MKVTSTLEAFPVTVKPLRGLANEAIGLIPSEGVNVIDPEGKNVAAVKRALQVAAKYRGVTLRIMNGDSGTLLVGIASARAAVTRTVRKAVEHAPESIAAEMQRLYELSGGKGKFDKATAEVKTKLAISAKRNLSRKANAA